MSYEEAGYLKSTMGQYSMLEIGEPGEGLSTRTEDGSWKRSLTATGQVLRATGVPRQRQSTWPTGWCSLPAHEDKRA